MSSAGKPEGDTGKAIQEAFAKAHKEGRMPRQFVTKPDEILNILSKYIETDEAITDVYSLFTGYRIFDEKISSDIVEYLNKNNRALLDKLAGFARYLKSDTRDPLHIKAIAYLISSLAEIPKEGATTEQIVQAIDQRLIIGLSLILSTSVGAYTFYKLRSMDYISTTGSAKKAVTSDKVKWISSFSRPVKVSTIKDGYAKMDNDLKEVKNFFVSHEIPLESIEISPVFMNEIYDNNSQAEKSYNLVQNITIQSTDIQKIANLSKNTNSLITDKGVLFSTSSLEYYYSKLPEVRVELLANAVADAKARAEQLALAGGKKIGVLKSASSGVVQVMAPNSVEVSDYGMYDTSSIDKEIMVTVKASFEIK